MRIRDDNGIETKQKRERIKTLKLECRYGRHDWGPSASLNYEKCQRSFCDAVRKIENSRVGTVDANGGRKA